MDLNLLENCIKFLMYIFKPILEGFGVYLNILAFILLCTSKSNKRIDNYLKLITITTCLLLLVSLGSQNYDCCFFTRSNFTFSYCIDYKANSFFTNVYQLYFQDITIQVLIFLITLTEISMTYDKLCRVQNKKGLLTKLNFSVIASIIVSISIATKIPQFFASVIKRNANETYEINISDFGGSVYYKIYDYGYKYLVASVTSIIYVVLVFRTIKNLIQFIRRKRLVTNAKSAVKSDEKNMVKIVIWIGLLRMGFILFYFIRSVCLILITNNISKSINQLVILHLIILLMEILVISTFNLNVFVIIRYHKTLRYLIFCRKTYK